MTPARLIHHTGVSWPRSGHHLLVSLLKGYFGSDFGYCEFHMGAPPNCPGLEHCCKQVPCAHPDQVTLSKNHDFDLDVPQQPDLRYLVQYRDFIPSVVSNFELSVRAGGADNAVAFRRFVSEQFGAYQAFMKKWVQTPAAANWLLVDYDDLTHSPEATLARVVQALSPDAPVDHTRVAHVVAEVDSQQIIGHEVRILSGAGVQTARKVEEFRFYDPEIFAQIEALILDRETVVELFRTHLGRDPAEGNMLRFQGYESAAALTAFIHRTVEYRRRQAQACAAARAPVSPPEVPPAQKDSTG